MAGSDVLRFFDPSFEPATTLLGARQALANIGNSAVMTVAGLYLLGEALSRTGAVEFIALAITAAVMAGFTDASLGHAGRPLPWWVDV